MSKLKLLQMQLALFFKDIESRPDKFIPKMEEISNNIFNQMPTILPIPNTAPPEIPVVILNSADGTYTCNIAKSRIDFIANLRNSNSDNISIQLEEFLSIIRSYAATVFGYKSIIRFGFIGQYFFETNDPVGSIQSKYFKNNLGDLEELNIRYNKRINCNGLTLNDIVELGQGSSVQDLNMLNLNIQNLNMKDGINIQRDINNVPNSIELPIEDVFLIIKSRLKEFDSNGVMDILQ